MVIYSIKDLMGLCTDYALDAQIQKILFSFDLWIPKAAREVHIDNVAQQRHATAAFTGFCRARSPTGNDSTNNSNNITNRLRRPFALRSMSAEVFPLYENDAMATNVSKTNSNSDRITLRKSVSVMNKKQRTGSGRSLIRAKSDMAGTLTQIVRNSERYFSDDPKTIADIEELALKYLFKQNVGFIRELSYKISVKKTTPNKYRKCSRRCFDGQLRTWRRRLHQFDEESKQDTTDPSEIDDLII
ncbi:unnamed protein product [Rotaria socialis]|nr:unnamed protein product [Rotaria socialis]